jgi:glutamate/tyrosine decarboxylase-like PLP-dependent enzyme
MGCGMYVTQHQDVLSSTFQVSANFMPSNLPQVDPYLNSVQWSRRFAGLRLFLSLAAASWTGYARHVEHSIRLAALVRQRLEAIGWSIVNESPLAVLCVKPPSEANGIPSIVGRLLATGQAWVAMANFEDQEIIRVCVTNGESTEHDVNTLISALSTAAQA